MFAGVVVALCSDIVATDTYFTSQKQPRIFSGRRFIHMLDLLGQRMVRAFLGWELRILCSTQAFQNFEHGCVKSRSSEIAIAVMEYVRWVQQVNRQVFAVLFDGRNVFVAISRGRIWGGHR